jgi:hypothetical protein
MPSGLLLNFNTRIQDKRILTIDTGSLAPVSKRPSVALTTHPIYHQAYRKSTAIPTPPYEPSWSVLW